MPAKTNNFNVESLKGHSLIRELETTIEELVTKMSNDIFENALRGAVIKETFDRAVN